jgi:HEAT repeat protein
MKIQVKLIHAQRLAESVQERLKLQVEAINLAARETQLGHTRDATKLVDGFVQQYPDSPWMPVIADLRAKIKAQNDGQARLSNAELLKSIGTLFLELEAANEKADDDARESATSLLAALASDYGPRLRKHAQSDDEQTRGLAIFALAFSTKPDDFASAEAGCSDSSSRVRTLTISAIAASGRSGVSADLLLKLLEDKTAGVRARAADAIAACIRRDDLSVQPLVDALDKMMVHDDTVAVRRSAIRAIEAIGGPGDIPRLEQALSHELDRGNRAAIQRAIERLRTGG